MFGKKQQSQMAAAGTEHASADQSIFEEARSWETSRASELEKSERRAWHIAGAATLLAVLGVAGIAAMGIMHARPVAPRILVTNKLTGDVEELSVFNPVKISGIDMVNKANAWKYVRSQEEYIYSDLQNDYDTVEAMSSPQVFATYAKKFSGDKPLDKVLGAGTAWRIERVSVTLPPDQTNTAIVHFRKIAVHLDGRPADAPEYFVARLTYTYKTPTGVKESDALNNPVGFKVLSYVVDSEAASAAPAVASAMSPVAPAAVPLKAQG